MPFIPEQRQYRTFEPMKAKRSDDEAESYVIEGYATTFDVPYDLGFSGAKEIIAKSALINADLSDVIFQYDHQGLVMARNRNNSLAILPDDHGLFVRADLGGSKTGRDLYEAISNGLIDRMSWGFLIAKDGWEWDSINRTSTITKVDKVFDVSAVSIPANNDTVISARSYLDGVIEQELRELQLRKEQAEKTRLSLVLKMQTLGK